MNIRENSKTINETAYLTESSFIAQLKSGDEQAFQQLIQEYQQKVLNTCYGFINSKEEAEDLTQDVFIEVFRSVRQFNGDSKFSTWLYRITVTKSLEELRRRKRQKRAAYFKSLIGLDVAQEIPIFASMKKAFSWRQIFILIGLLGAIQFLFLTALAMYLYPGGTIHEPDLESYSFFTNYFSDLGRTYTFDRTPNTACHYLFKTSLTITGFSLILFFIVTPTLFESEASKVCIAIALCFGVAASLCYIGIGWVPWDQDYWNHTGYVRTGFLAFLGMTFFYSIAILFDHQYPNKYAWAFLIFGLVLGIQIVIMLFGPRAYRNEHALLLQAIAQKVVVYAEILVMIYQANGALLMVSREQGD